MLVFRCLCLRLIGIGGLSQRIPIQFKTAIGQYDAEICRGDCRQATMGAGNQKQFYDDRKDQRDYRGNIAAGESVRGETWIDGPAQGAKSDRRVDFRNEAGKVIVSARTTWAMLDKDSQRLVRVRPEVIEPFRVSGES